MYERVRFVSLAFNSAARVRQALGNTAENAWLGNVLLSAARRRPAIAMLSPANVLACTPGEHSATVTIAHEGGQRTLRCALVAVADGAESGLRAALGIGTRTNDYGQQAIVANICCSQPHRATAYDRVAEWGPMALLPLGASAAGAARMALVWTMPPERAERLLAGSDGVFLNTLQQRFGPRQGQFSRVGQRHSYPLKLVAAEE